MTKYFKLFIFQLYSTMATPRTSREKVLDSHLLDANDDDFTLTVNEDDYRILKETPRSGKRIRMNSPPPRSPASDVDSPSTTPPRRVTSPERIQALPNDKLELKHVCTTNVYIHTDERCQLQKITDAEFTTHPEFYKRKGSLENLVTRARMIIMQQEPFHTMLNQGYDFDLNESQLSYKVYASEDEELVDYIVDLRMFNKPTGPAQMPKPFYTEKSKCRSSQVDVSFRFHMEQGQQLPKKPLMTSIGTSTFDSELITPIIDHIRFTAVKLSGIIGHKDTFGPQYVRKGPTTPPPADEEPLNPPQRERSTSSSRSRAQDRLGPPIPRQFNPRNRGHNGPKYRPRGFQGAKRARHQQF